MDPLRLQAVLDRYGLEAVRIDPALSGLINVTWFVMASDRMRYVLQKVNPMFPPLIHQDIDAVTVHVRKRGVAAPCLVHTADGGLFVDFDGAIWRLTAFVDGESRHALSRPAESRAAGRALAGFHRAVDDLDHAFMNVRPGVHDTERHLQRLQRALQEKSGHPRHAEVEPLGRRILSCAADLPSWKPTRERIVHGDPKISNFLFKKGADEVLCLVDVDTFGRMSLPLELGDAFRSWCNRAGEDTRGAEFCAELFQGGIEGYAGVATGWITPDEIAAIVPATRSICVELAARFCADALYEDFFAWDA
ncbi:MAG: phosphotransferase, partial [Gammaproteobacteria bacterium]|nr:phosphotransferase [Gammaproteobacteria bacterium]